MSIPNNTTAQSSARSSFTRFAQHWQRGSLARHLLVRLLPPIALLVFLDLAVTWVLTQKMIIEEWLLRDIFWTMVLTQSALVALFAWVLIRGLRSGLAAMHLLSEQIAEQGDSERLQPLNTQGLPTEILPVVVHLNALLARLDDTLQAQKRFIGHAAHQFRTPLSSLRLESELMLARELPTDVRQRAERIKYISDRLIRLGEQLLALAKADRSSRVRDSFKRVNLCDWTREIGAEWFTIAADKGVTLQLVAPDGAVWVDADAILLQELLTNLLDNALRYGAGGKEITIRVTATPPSLAVEDYGEGITSNAAQHIFDAFYRAPQVKDYGGSGLGLAIVQEIAHAHGAWVNVHSRPVFSGTRVVVVFPGPRIGMHLHRSAHERPAIQGSY